MFYPLTPRLSKTDSSVKNCADPFDREHASCLEFMSVHYCMCTLLGNSSGTVLARYIGI